MAFAPAEVAVTTTATLLFTGATAKDLYVRVPKGSATLFVGTAGVTPATGYPVLGELHLASLVVGDDLYGVTDAAAGSVKARILVRT